MFDNHFEVFLADTEESKKKHYAIRYQVYCEEMQFENKDDFPQQMEYDDDDDKSIHFIVRNKKTKQWVGAMRLIHKTDSQLPIEQSCGISIAEQLGTVEMSRLCLIKDVRRGFKDIDPPNGICNESNEPKETDKIKLISSQHKLNRLIIWGIFYAAAKYCYNNKMQYCYFMTTAILARALRKGGLGLVNIGEPCQHKGERFPFKLDAIATYQSDIWQGSNTGYQLFSELQVDQYYKMAS